VGVEKVRFSQNSQNFGDRKCLGDPRTSLVGLPNAILFLRISGQEVFQQPQAISLNDPGRALPSGVVGVIAILQQPRLVQ
jgi:hypothetical protein